MDRKGNLNSAGWKKKKKKNLSALLRETERESRQKGVFIDPGEEA
jgi:hypothetical protein